MIYEFIRELLVDSSYVSSDCLTEFTFYPKCICQSLLVSVAQNHWYVD